MAADDYAVIAKRQRELAAELDSVLAGHECECPMHTNVHGVLIKAHVLGCPTIVGHHPA